MALEYLTAADFAEFEKVLSAAAQWLRTRSLVKELRNLNRLKAGGVKLNDWQEGRATEIQAQFFMTAQALEGSEKKPCSFSPRRVFSCSECGEEMEPQEVNDKWAGLYACPECEHREDME